MVFKCTVYGQSLSAFVTAACLADNGNQVLLILDDYGHSQGDLLSGYPWIAIVTLPSYYGEGLPKVLIEAAAFGRAVITTDMPGCRDAIESDISGVLVPTRDAKKLAGAIEHLITDVALRQ